MPKTLIIFQDFSSPDHYFLYPDEDVDDLFRNLLRKASGNYINACEDEEFEYVYAVEKELFDENYKVHQKLIESSIFQGDTNGKIENVEISNVYVMGIIP